MYAKPKIVGLLMTRYHAFIAFSLLPAEITNFPSELQLAHERVNLCIYRA